MVSHANATEWRWNERREEAALLRSQGKDWPEIAKATGYTHGTVRRFVLEPAFNRRVQELRAERSDRAFGLLSDAAESATRTLIELMRTGTPEDSTRLRAAANVLDRLGVTAQTARAAAVSVNVAVGVQHVERDHPDLLAARQLILGALPGGSGLMGAGLLPGAAPAAGPDPV